MKPILFYDDVFLKHDTGYHPESARRLKSIRKHLQDIGLWEDVRDAAREASEEEIGAVHDAGYISHCRKLAEGGGGMLDPDTVVSRGSYPQIPFSIMAQSSTVFPIAPTWSSDDA